MASNLTLMIKEGGELTHANLASLWHSQSPDCILNGCNISVSANVCYMSAGYLLIAGRIIRVGESSWTIPTTGAGASLVLTIDSETLDASMRNVSNPSLTQDDINLGGQTYQAKIATFAVQNGSASLTGTIGRLAQSGVIYGTAEHPASTDYPNGTIYVQYQ